MLAWATSLNMFKTSTVLLMNSNKNAPVIHSLFFYVLLKYFCPTTPWNNEAIVSKVWNLCLCFSLSPSCCLFLVFCFVCRLYNFFYYSVVLLLSLAANSGSWERPNNGFEKVSESASWKRQPRPLSALYHQTTLALVSASFFTLTCNTTCHWYLSFLSYFVFLPSFLLFYLACVLQTTPHPSLGYLDPFLASPILFYFTLYSIVLDPYFCFSILYLSPLFPFLFLLSLFSGLSFITLMFAMYHALLFFFLALVSWYLVSGKTTDIKKIE